MSNWSRVIVTWCGTDGCVYPPGNTEAGYSTDVRLEAIGHAFAACGYGADPVAVAYPCGDDPQHEATACESSVIFEVNHFWPVWTEGYPMPGDQSDLVSELRKLAWEYPEQVQVLWKSEEMDRYASIGIQPGEAPQGVIP